MEEVRRPSDDEYGSIDYILSLHPQHKYLMHFLNKNLELRFQIECISKYTRFALAFGLVGLAEMTWYTVYYWGTNDKRHIGANTVRIVTLLFWIVFIFVITSSSSKKSKYWLVMHRVALLGTMILCPAVFFEVIEVVNLLVVQNVLQIAFLFVHAPWYWLVAMPIFHLILNALFFATGFSTYRLPANLAPVFLLSISVCLVPAISFILEKHKRRIFSLGIASSQYQKQIREIFKEYSGDTTNFDPESSMPLMPTLSSMQEELIAAKKMNEDLRKAKSEAERFLSTMSHELRSPLHAITAAVSAMKEETLSPSVDNLVDILSTGCEQLLRSINEILDFQDAQYGSSTMENETFNLEKTINSVLLQFRERISSKKLLVCTSLTGPDHQRYLLGDAHKIKSVITHLVDNAIKFTDNGEVMVKATIEADESEPEAANVTLCIKDTGCGFDEEELESILFKPFSQIDSAITRKHDGTGLGLAICEKYCKMMKGRISAEGMKGIGSTFTCQWKLNFSANGTPLPPLNPSNRHITAVVQVKSAWSKRCIQWELEKFGVEFKESCPVDTSDVICICDSKLSAVQIANACKAGAHIIILNSSNENLRVPKKLANDCSCDVLNSPILPMELQSLVTTIFEQSPNDNNPLAQPATLMQSLDDIDLEEFGNTNIMLVEDNLINQKIGVCLLKKLGCTVTTANNGQEAVDIFNSSPNNAFDLILMDLHMPIMNGIDSARAITGVKREKQLELPRIVALTADVTLKARQECRQVGMCDVLSKPCNKTQLAQCIRRWLK